LLKKYESWESRQRFIVECRNAECRNAGTNKN